MARLPNLIGTMFVATLVLLHTRMPFVDAAENPPARAARQVYRCEVAGVATFSDRPCGAGMRPYDLDLSRINILEAPAPLKSDKAAPSRSTVPRPAALSRQSEVAAEEAQAEVCRRLQRSLQKIASRMRAGYTAKAGERLQAQRRELQAKRRARHC